MVITIRELISRCDWQPEQTVYRGERDEVLSFPLTLGDFFEGLKGTEKSTNFYPVYQFHRACRREEQKNGMELLTEHMRLNQRQTEEARKMYRGRQKKNILSELKSEAKVLRREMHLLRMDCCQAVIAEQGEDFNQLYFLEYKNRVMLTSFENMIRMVPVLGESHLPEFVKFPWLTTNLSKLRSAVRHQKEIGVVGGPCLFGMDEVLVEVETDHGGRELFDCSCGRNCAGGAGRLADTLEEYLGSNVDDIKSLRILNRKTGITRQEYISLLYVFEIAALLDAKVVIPLPDISYLKYMDGCVKELGQTQKQQFLADFQAETDRITDLFLTVIDVLRRQYPQVAVMVLHRREKELIERFYEKRKPFINDSSYMKKLTRMSGKKEAVIDYITMLALPYYFYGITQIVQVDSLDETDSGRKCQKIHKDRIWLHSLLYPEFISRDGKSTIYHTTFTYKDYLRSEEY